MERMLAVMADEPVATAAGFFAPVCFAAWPLFRSRRMILASYIGNNLGFALHYALQAHWTAVAMNGFMSVQTIVGIMLDRRPRLRGVYYAMMPLVAVASVVTWQGLPSLLAAAATTLSTIGRMQTNNVVLRVFNTGLNAVLGSARSAHRFGSRANRKCSQHGNWRDNAATAFTGPYCS